VTQTDIPLRSIGHDRRTFSARAAETTQTCGGVKLSVGSPASYFSFSS
jgi:hypothetical protein